MPSNSEMYERGALDAEHDDLNAFYYQHYYYYRRGYNEARRQLRGGLAALRPAWPLAILLVLALAGGAYWLLARPGLAGVAPVPPTPGASPTAAASAVALAPAPAAPTPTVTPTPAPSLQVGGRARVVNVGESTLRARAEPGLAGAIRIVARFSQDAEVTIVEGPREADGLIWWRISGAAGEGWSAERSPEGTSFLEPLP